MDGAIGEARSARRCDRRGSSGAAAPSERRERRTARLERREGGAIDLSAALQPLSENVPSLDIHMDIETPLTLDDPEIALRIRKQHHAGFVLRSDSHERIEELMEQYGDRFMTDFAAAMPDIAGRRVWINGEWVSKANTAMQLVLTAVVLAELALATDFGPLRLAQIILSGLLTVASAGAYLVAWSRHMSKYGEGGTHAGQ